jgi:hypothetical protein
MLFRNIRTKVAGILLITLAFALSSHAGENAKRTQDPVKTALNEMVRDVHTATTPVEKREILTRFIGRATFAAGALEMVPFLSQEKQVALDELQAKFDAYGSELKGPAAGSEGYGVADKDLNAFASFMQQDLEQADNGGIYLSTGAIIIILLILILIT